MKNISVLIIEDNKTLAEQIYSFFEQQGAIVDYSHTGLGGWRLIEKQDFDLIILDLMLPDIDGVELCRRIKQETPRNIPVLMLTALGAIEDKRLGFGAGADDYLSKPFILEELLLRARALCKREQLHQDHEIHIEDLVINTATRQACRAGHNLKLNRSSFQILEILARAHPNAVSRSQLIKQLWGEDVPSSDSLRSHIYALRNVLDKPFPTTLLTTVHGVGFILEGTTSPNNRSAGSPNAHSNKHPNIGRSESE